MLFPHYERIVVLVELEAAATGLFASAAFFDDDLGAEVRPGAHLFYSSASPLRLCVRHLQTPRGMARRGAEEAEVYYHAEVNHAGDIEKPRRAMMPDEV